MKIGKDIANEQATQDAVAANVVDWKRLHELTHKMESVKEVHTHTLHGRDAKVNALKLLVANSKKRAEGAESKREGARACLENLQTGQQKHFFAESRVHSKIRALDEGL